MGVDGVLNQDGQTCRKSSLSADSKQFLPPDFIRRWITKRATVRIILLASYSQCTNTHHVIADDPCDCDAVVQALGSIVGRGLEMQAVLPARISSSFAYHVATTSVSSAGAMCPNSSSFLPSHLFLLVFISALFGHDCSALSFLLGDYFSEATGFSLSGRRRLCRLLGSSFRLA